MNYKPYSMEWNRRRYLAEAIQQYFDSDASVDDVVNDLVDILSDNIEYHKDRAEKFTKVLNNFKS